MIIDFDLMQLESAARRVYENGPRSLQPWDLLPTDIQDHYRQSARVAIEGYFDPVVWLWHVQPGTMQ